MLQACHQVKLSMVSWINSSAPSAAGAPGHTTGTGREAAAGACALPPGTAEPSSQPRSATSTPRSASRAASSELLYTPGTLSRTSAAGGGGAAGSTGAQCAIEQEHRAAATAGGAGALVRYSLQSLRARAAIRKALGSGYDAAIGLGGFASLPGMIAARHLGLPVVLLEQNQVPGKVNRLAAPFVDAVTCPSPEVVERIGGRREGTGNPVRGTVVRAARRRSR